MDYRTEMTQIEELRAEIEKLKKNGTSKISLETWLKLSGAMLTIVTVAIGVFQYVSTRQNEFRKAFWTEQFALYREACSAAASIAISEDIKTVEKERGLFWNLYWGKLSIIEHSEVKDAMVAFGNQLYEVEAERAHPRSLKLLSFGLARACRQSLAKTWNPVDIGDLDEEKPFLEQNREQEK